MTEQQISAALDELIGMVAAGETLAAVDKFYHPDLEKTDFITGLTYRGKAENDRANQELLASITAFRELSAVGKIVKGDRSFIIWHIDIDHADKGTINTTEVAIQDWKDGKIITERFIS